MPKHSIWLNSILKYVVASILISVPLFPKFPFIMVPGTFVSVRLEDLLLAFAGIIGLIFLIPQAGKFLKDPVNLSIFLFIATGLISLSAGILITGTVEPHIGILHWLRRIEYLIPFYLGVISIREDRRNLHFYINTLLVVILFTFTYGFGQKYLDWPIIITQNSEYAKGIALHYIPGGHINSSFAGHYDLATFMVLVMPFLVLSFFLVKEKWAKLIFAMEYVFGMWLLVNTASRISMAAYLMSVTLALLFVRKFKALMMVLFVSILFVGFSSSLIARYERIIEVLNLKRIQQNSINLVVKPIYAQAPENIPQKRVLSPTPVQVEVFEDRSTNIRLNVEWPRAIRAFMKNPLLGTGYSSITLATDNEFLRLLGETGILGLLAFLTIFINIAVIFLKKFPLTGKYKGLELALLAGTFAALPGIFLNAVFIDVFEASKFAILFWLILGFSAGLLDEDIYTKK